MWTRRALAGLSVAALASPALAQAGGRKAEAAALRAFAETTHPRGREAAADPAWRDGWAAFEPTADTLSDGAYVVGLMRQLRWFRDGHTTVLPFEFVGGVPAALAQGPFGRHPPLKVRVFEDGLWIEQAGGPAAPLLRGRITSAGGVSDVEIMRRLEAVWPAGNAAWPHRWAPQVFASAGLAQGLGLWPDPSEPLPVEVSWPDGRTARAAIPTASGVDTALQTLQRTPLPHEGWATAAKATNYARLLDRALYLSVDEMADVPGKTFTAFTREAFAAMASPQAERLIVDLRRNGGGDNYLGESLRKGIERSRFNRPGGLYVLTSPRTFSAAQNLANRIERETFALFVGGPTGGAPNHYGDGKPFVGSATGVTAIVSSVPWFDSYPQDRRPWILPDLGVADGFADWVAGRDAALETALAHHTEAPADDLAPGRVFFFARASQKAAWTPFWRLPA